MDAEILADVYLAMTGGQTSFLLTAEDKASSNDNLLTQSTDIIIDGNDLITVYATNEELEAHTNKLDVVSVAAGSKSVWQELDSAGLEQGVHQ